MEEDIFNVMFYHNCLQSLKFIKVYKMYVIIIWKSILINFTLYRYILEIDLNGFLVALCWHVFFYLYLVLFLIVDFSIR